MDPREANRVVRAVRFGTGAAARRAADHLADELRESGTPARALFKLDQGGWVVNVYAGWLGDPAKRPGSRP